MLMITMKITMTINYLPVCVDRVLSTIGGIRLWTEKTPVSGVRKVDVLSEYRLIEATLLLPVDWMP